MTTDPRRNEGVVYGAIDLRRTPDDGDVFLEVNRGRVAVQVDGTCGGNDAVVSPGRR